MNTKLRRGIKISVTALLLVIEFLVAFLLSYVAYVCAGYYRIADNLELTVNNNQSALVQLETVYTISTYNIGFGAYSQDFDFFMDSGEMLDGTLTQGTGSRAKSKEVVQTNLNGVIDTIQNLDVDFAFFQEVDVSADRSYFVNEYRMLQVAFNATEECEVSRVSGQYSSSIGINMHTSYLCYPLYEPHGSTEAGIVTLSKYNVSSATRRSFPIDESFLEKFFDLDRCFVVTRLAIENTDKELVLINLHMSAYDEGGVIRAQQLELLTSFMQAEYEKGNYVIAGGDWNHDISNSIGAFETQQKVPSWVKQITDRDIPEGFNFATTKNTVATCRSTDMAYTEGVNYTVVVDGFLYSDNIQLNSVENVDTNFMYSDHNPVVMSFTLLPTESE